jgi:hypothetical protein
MAGCFEHCNETSDSEKNEESLEQLSNYYFLKNDPATWS